jgi:hypothetical protein
MVEYYYHKACVLAEDKLVNHDQAIILKFVHRNRRLHNVSADMM